MRECSSLLYHFISLVDKLGAIHQSDTAIFYNDLIDLFLSQTDAIETRRVL